MADMPKRTLRAGIIVGILGVLAITLTARVVERAGFTLNNAPMLGEILSVLWQLVTVGFLPFSAALISASLVMRHIDAHNKPRESLTVDPEHEG